MPKKRNFSFKNAEILQTEQRNVLCTIPHPEKSSTFNLPICFASYLFSYTSIFLLILCVENTYRSYKSVFSTHCRPGQPLRLFRIWFLNFSINNISESSKLLRFFSSFLKLTAKFCSLVFNFSDREVGKF